MAFGIKRNELQQWKAAVSRGEVAFLTHYWMDPRFPDINTVTKVGCSDLDKLAAWCVSHGLNPRYIHRRQPFPHYDLMGNKQLEILHKEGQDSHIERFHITRKE